MDLDNKALELAKQLGTPDHIKSIDIDDDRLQVYIDELKIQLPGLDEAYYRSHALARLSHFVACDGGNPELQNEKGATKLADAKQRDYLKDIATDGLASIKQEIINANVKTLESVKDTNTEQNKNLLDIINLEVTNRENNLKIIENIQTSNSSLQNIIVRQDKQIKDNNENLQLTLTATNDIHKDIIKGIALIVSVLGTLLLAILLAILFAPRAKAQVDLLSLQNNGIQVKLWAGGKAIVNCDGTTVTCTWDAVNKRVTIASVAGGAGTVTSVGNVTLTGLFACTVSNATTTPSWSCAASSAGAHTFWGNNTGIGAAGSFVQPACGDLSDNNTGCNHLAPATIANAAHKWLNSYTQSTGVFTQTQPDCADLTNAAAHCGTAADELSSGTLTDARLTLATIRRRGLSFAIGDASNSSALTTSSVSSPITVPYGCTISAYNLGIDAGTITVKFWKIATGTAIPTVANVINTSGLAISSGTAIHSTTVSDFTTTTITANDIIIMAVTAVATAKEVNGVLQCDM